MDSIILLKVYDLNSHVLIQESPFIGTPVELPQILGVSLSELIRGFFNSNILNIPMKEMAN